MGLEVERKFLVKSDSYKKIATKTKIVQGFLSDNSERMVRIRIHGENAMLTIKGPLQGISRLEFNYPIPVVEAKQLLTLCLSPLIEKIRYELSFEALLWEVDEFKGENEGLVIAEVELPHTDHDVKLPDFIGKEVTSDRKYYNASLISHPYKNWV